MRFATAALLFSLLVSPAPASSRSRSHRRSLHAEITAVARVETAPRRTTHTNHREFEELDVLIVSAEPAADRGTGDPILAIDTKTPVHVVHDLSCGGEWLDAKPGDRLEIKGEYVHPPRGGDLIHFTHPASAAGCGPATHADGYIRLAAVPSAAGAPAPAGGEDLFVTAIRPVLARHCAPCHEKGGKMYARLPFDQPSVLSSHAAGVRKRLKGDDLAAFEKWMATLSASPAS